MTATDITGGDDKPRLCGGPKRNGEGLCTRPAGWGTGHPGYGRCKLHGGSTPTHEKAGQKAMLRAEIATDLSKLGVTVDLVDGDAIRAMRDEAAGNVIVLRRLIQQLDLSVSGFEYDPATEKWRPPSVDGIAVRTYHQSGIATGEAKVHVLVAMYNDERDRLAKLDEACVKLGLEERRTVVGEVQAAVLARAMTALIDSPELALTREQRELGRQLAGRQLRALVKGGS